MIFVTVGTHEQQFNRLIECIDKLVGNGVIKEEVIIQTGYSTYKPKNCTWKNMFSYKEMEINVAKARIVITHGGPSSFIMPLRLGKVPIVIPRKNDFDEHVNNHQVNFCNEVAERMGNIVVVEDTEILGKIIENYEDIVSKMSTDMKNNNEKFCTHFEKIVQEMFEK